MTPPPIAAAALGLASELNGVLCFQVGAGSEETEGRAADEQAERAGAEKPRLQPDQQREEPETRGFPAQTVQHAASEQVSRRHHTETGIISTNKC